MWANISGDYETASEQNTVSVPEKRKKRARSVSIKLCGIAAVLIIVYYGANGYVDEYYPDATQKNTTNVCYRKKKKLTFPGLFTTTLSLFGVVLGTLVDRLSHIAEERHHIQSRYDGSFKKMIKACFSGMKKGPVIVLLGLAAIFFIFYISITGKPWFELSYLVYIFSGIGVGPLIMQLLNLNTESEVYISTILEEKQTNVANGLAWSFYFNYLEEALPKFNESVPRNGRNEVELEREGGRVHLNSNKLILLITQDCKTEDLPELDNNIKELGTFKNGKYTFPVYELTYSGDNYRYVIRYVKQPLETLAIMSQYARIKVLDEEQREYQVKLLYKTLSEILGDTLNTKCQDKCILVGIHANSRQSLKNGKLASVIQQQVEADQSPLEHEDGPIKVFSHTTPKQGRRGRDVAQRKKNKTNTEENIDTPLIPRQEVDDASGASTSGVYVHENQANTAEL